MGVGITCPNCRNVFPFSCEKCSSFETEIHQSLELVQYFQSRGLFYLKCRRCKTEFDHALCPQCHTRIIPEKPFVTGDKGGLTRAKWCFVATACVGENSNILEPLYHFRDQLLAKNRFGRSFIRFYYNISPGLAFHISQRSFLRVSVKFLIVFPVYFMSLTIMKVTALFKTEKHPKS